MIEYYLSIKKFHNHSFIDSFIFFIRSSFRVAGRADLGVASNGHNPPPRKIIHRDPWFRTSHYRVSGYTVTTLKRRDRWRNRICNPRALWIGRNAIIHWYTRYSLCSSLYNTILNEILVFLHAYYTVLMI